MAMHWETLSGKFSLAASMLAMLYAQTNDRIVVVSNYTQVSPEPYTLDSSLLAVGCAGACSSQIHARMCTYECTFTLQLVFTCMYSVNTQATRSVWLSF